MFFSLFILALTHISTHLDGKIRDRMHSIWHPDPARSLDSHYSLQYKFTESVVNRIWERAIRNGLQPTLFGLFALAAIGLTILSVTSRIYFSIADSYGVFCSVDVKTRTTSIGHYYSGPLTFDPSNVCWPTGILVEKGATYRLVINIADTMGSWKDGKLEADLQGNLEDYSFWPAISAWPAKRYPWEKYYKPIARIRTHAPRVPYRDEYVLNPTFLSSKKRYDCLVSDFMAQSSGELFLFVNDAIIYFLPNTVFGTYQNNGGKAEVFVKRIVIAGEPFALPENMATTSACQEFVSSQPQRVSILDQ